ncbi:galactokinase [Pseudothermotoga thermarum]|uniref:Galactokinase n=1 Tax=Pseudothermotoga thermarum DSM 5069 TaxID=688269 RepID=F7YTX1_9THEM|nr:galactokinase [Pseudothermotoga thermarum]AEH51421.1 galactokinase [Pseudothermotoga thermarum DSM 5069]
MPKFRAPGRVNIIGEHTDYNDGFVLPFAIDKYVEVDIQPSDRFEFHSDTFNETVVLERHQKLGKWTDYPMGVIWAIEQMGFKVEPVKIHISSTLPIGSGLSSSAALEISVAYGLREIFKLPIDGKQLVEIGVKAEREFVGVRCGVMDQFTAVFGKKDYALLLDTMTLSFEYVPLNLGDYEFVLIDTQVKHELSSSEYNKRRAECEQALKVISKKSFREVKPEDLEILDPILKKRAKHVIDENARVLKAVKALRENRFYLLGELLYESHTSLRDLYEVSCDELDFIVGFLKGKLGILGARMVGGGFGGSVLVLARKNIIEWIFPELDEHYFKTFGKHPKLIKVQSDDGMKAL